jgi:hypothetical protein
MALDLRQHLARDELLDRLAGHPLLCGKQIVEGEIIKVFQYLRHLCT